MLQLFGIAFFLILTIAPGLYVRSVMRRFSKERHYQGNGSQLVKHLLTRFQVEQIEVVEDASGDFYNPHTRSIHLLPAHFHGNSLTAVSVATHEFAHALQHQKRSRLFLLRTRLATLLTHIQPVGALCFFAALALMPVAPRIGVTLIAVAIASRLLMLLLHLVTLPIEMDASFNKALPILIEGNYLREEDKSGAKKILFAAALTYVSKALEQLLIVWRWLIVRR